MKDIELWVANRDCAYGSVCDTPMTCSGVRLDLPAAMETELVAEGFYVMPGFRPAHSELGLKALKFCSVEVCDNALDDLNLLARVSELEALEIEV